MANLYQIWDKEVQGLDSVGAKPEQIEARRQAIAAHFEQKARQAGMSSKDIYATLDNFDSYSRQKTSRFDDGLTPEERAAAQDDGSTILGLNKGGLKEGLKAVKDLGLGIVSSAPRMVGDLAQTWSDVGDNDPTELSAQLAKASYDAAEDIKSNYSEGTKQRKKDFWSPTGLAMGLGENLGQIAVGAGVTGAAMKGASLLTKGNKAVQLGAGVATGGGLAYGQGYGQGKESALDEINKTSNNDLYANVVTQFDEWKNKGGKSGDKPYLVELYQEANGDLNAMKDLMAEDAGAKAGLLTAATAPIAMGASSFMARNVARDVAASGANRAANSILRQTGARDTGELARRIAAGEGVGSIARQGLKIAGKQSGLQAGEEFIQEGGEGLFAADAGSEARGDKGVLSADDWKNVGQQGLQGAAIGAVMGGGGSLLTMRDTQNTGIAQAKARTELPKQYQDSFNAFEDAKQAEAQAQAAYEANPTPESEDALVQATDARLKANNQFTQYDAAFKQTFTEQEQKDLLANDLKGIAARAKLAEEAKQAELNSKAEQEALAKAQRANMVKGLAAYADNESVLINEVNQLGLDDTQKELLLREVFAERKNAKAKPQQTQTKTPLEMAVDEHFDAKGNRKPSVISPDVADKHKVSLNELLPAIAKRNNDIKIEKAQAEKQAKVDAFNKSQAQQKTKDVQREQLAEQQQLENTLADFAAENDTDSMLSMLEGYDKTEADKLFNNAFKTVETRTKEAEKATKAKEAETAKQAQAKQKQSAFNADMSALYESNPNATYNDWKAVGKKYGITSAIDLANAWASLTSKKPVKNQEQAKPTEPLTLPAPNNVMVTDAQGNTTQTTENNVPKKQRNADVSVPSGLNIDVSNAANTQRDRGVGSYIGNASNLIVRQDGKPFPTEQVAQQALTNKSTKKTKAKKNEPVISKDTHTVVPVDGGYAIAPVEQVNSVVQQEAKVESKQESVQEQTDDITGQYTHSQFPDATATVTKTDKGYDVDWGDEVQSFTGKNAADKTQSALKKENFNKKNPDDNNGGVAVEPVAPKPKPVSPSGGVIPRVHLDRISRGLKDGKTVEEIATKIQKSLPHLTIEDVTQQVLAAQEKASKPATLDSIIGKYSDDEEVDEEIRQSAEVLKKFLPETVDDWKIDNDTFATRGAWSVSYTKPHISIDRKTGKEVVNSTTKSAPLDGDVLLSGDEQAIKDHIKERLTKNGITPRGVKNWQLDDAVSPVGQQAVDNTPTQSIEGEYQHSKIESAKATVTKTDKGYDVDWGDEVESFTGKNAAEKTQAALKKENFNKKNPDDDNGGVAVEPVAPKPVLPSGNTTQTTSEYNGFTDNMSAKEAGRVKSVLSVTFDYGDLGVLSRSERIEQFAKQGVFSKSNTEIQRIKAKEDHPDAYFTSAGYLRDKYVDVLYLGGFTITKTEHEYSQYLFEKNKEKDYSKSTGQQISEAMDKTAQAITDAAHSKVVERIKDGEEIVYKQPAAIERVKQDERYQVEINDKGHAVVKNVKDNNGNWVKQDEPVTAESSHIENGKIEEVTGEVIRESLAKVDDKPINGRTMSLKEAKQWLLDSIDKAIAVAPKTLNKAGKDAIEIVNTFSRVEESKTQKEELEKARKILEPLYITFDVPNDGKFKVLNTIESLQRFKANIEKTKGFTENQKPVKPFSAPSENSPETTIMGFLNDGELENAYFFAENQDKPIKFTLSRRGEPIAYFLTEPVDLGNNITGFVGISTDPMSKSKRWLVIEEKSRTSIGFEEISKQAAIKSAKARLSALKKEDLEGFASKITPINKTDEEMKADWLAKNNIKIDEQSNEENSIKSTKLEGIIKVDFPLEETVNAWQHSVRNPSEVAKSFRKDFEDFIEDAYNSALLQAETDLQKEALEQASLKLQQDYIKRFNELNAARSGVVSSFIAGRNNFNGKQAENRGNNFDKVSQRFDNWLLESKYELSTAVQDARSPEQLAKIKAEKDAKEQKLQDKNDEFLRKVLDFKKGDDFTIGKNQYKVVRVNRNKDGMPISLTLEGEGLIKGIDDKISLFGRGMAYPTINDLREAIARVQEKDESELIPKKSDNEDLAPVEKAQQAKQPTKKERLLIKIDDELDAALDDFAAIFKEQGKRLSSGVDPVIMGKVLAIGMKASTLYLAKGAVKFAVWSENIISALSSKGVSQDLVEPYLKGLYLASKAESSPEIRQQMDNQDFDNKPKFSQSSSVGDRTITQVREKLVKHFGEKIISLLEKKGILKIHQSLNDEGVPNEVKAEDTADGAYFDGTIYLIADNLTDETILGTFVHELGVHKGFQEMMSPKTYELIMTQFNRLVEAKNPIALAAKQRAEEAESLTDEDKQGKTPQQILNMEKEALARQKDEYLPYLITEQAKNEQATPQERNAIKRLIDHILRAVKGWVVRHLSKYDTTYKMSRRVSESLTPADILYMAERMVGDIAKRGGDNNNRPKFSKTEQSQFDQLLAKADKMIAEQGKLLAPNGKPSKLNRVQWAQVRTDNFKNWFGDWENDPENSSKAVDENGEPKVVYHGSGQEFYIFDKKKATDSEGRKYGVGTGKGVFSFTENNDIASNWANRAKNRAEYGVKSDMPTVISAFLNIKRPITRNEFESMLDEKFIGYDFRLPKIRDKFISEIYTELKKKKIDGIMSDFGEITAFYPTQIKSAIGNNGEFSPTNPDIRFSRAEDKAKAAKDYVLDSVRISNQAKANLHAKAELGWWSKTIGTQLNTAKKFKDFDRVYKLLQRLLQHTSSDVMDALEVAPTLLEKLDSLSDLKEQGKSIGRNIAQYARKVRTGEMTDREAVAKVIFSETLAKKPLSQAELEQKLTPQQLKLYEEAREAINVSLKNTAKSEIIRSLLQNDVINFDTVEKLLNQQTGFDAFIDEMLENVGARISNAQEELSQAETDVEKQAIKDELKRLADMYNSISDVNTKVYKLIDEAYAPLMRFGDYALTMRDKTTGKVLSFMMFESKAERNRMVNYLGTEYGDTVTLETDTMSTEEFKQFKGITPESLALFAKEIGLSQDEATQAYLKLAIPATSALTRRIHRKGTEGYNEDIQRVLASFVMSNARYSAKNIYLAKVNEAINDIESGKSIKDQALKMRDNTINPADTSAWLRDLLFVWNLGGSVMFAFVNMTQPFLQTIPMLSQYVNTGFATKHILRGIKVAGAAMVTGNAPKGYEAEYKRAVQEGIVDPQNTFMLTGLERGGTGTTSKTWTGTKHILGIFAQMSESLNRKAVFIASLEVANAKGGAWLKQKGYASAYDFAVDVISQTQGVYNKANRSNWAHSQLGAPLLVFKQFSINYVEQMIRMLKNQSAGEEGKKAVLLMLFMLFSLAGGMGLPFIKDIFDGSETIAAFMGNPVNIEREMRLMGKQYLGETTTGALMDGWLNKLVIGEVLGADVQSRTGMGDLIPMTNVLNPVLSDSQRVNEAASIFGAAGGLGEKAGDSIQFAANDEWGDAFINILPHFATSLYRGTEMMTTGETTDSKGRKLFDTTFGEGLVKFFDSQPVRMAELSRARGLEYDDIAIQSSKIDYYKKKWIKAAQKEDMEAIEQIEQDIEDWNENNEKYPVIFDRQRAYQSANKNEMTWGEREERTPKGMEWLKEERPDFVRD